MDCFLFCDKATVVFVPYCDLRLLVFINFEYQSDEKTQMNLLNTVFAAKNINYRDAVRFEPHGFATT